MPSRTAKINININKTFTYSQPLGFLLILHSYYNSWRGVTVDNYFSSIPLVDKLRALGSTFAETLRSNKPEFPPSFLPQQNRAEHDSKFCFDQFKTLFPYVPKVKNFEMLISAEYHRKQIDNSDSKNVQSYNDHKGVVDTVDKLRQNFTVRCKTNHWTVKF